MTNGKVKCFTPTMLINDNDNKPSLPQGDHIAKLKISGSCTLKN